MPIRSYNIFRHMPLRRSIAVLRLRLVMLTAWALGKLRRGRRQGAHSIEALLAMVPPSDISHVGWQGWSIDTETHHALAQVFASLPDRSLLVFLMSQVDGLGYAEIALELGLSRRAVRRAMLRAIVAIDAAYKTIERPPGEEFYSELGRAISVSSTAISRKNSSSSENHSRR
jgi:hypothetical protein